MNRFFSRWSRRAIVVFLLTLLSLTASFLDAQTSNTGTMTGTVTDASGALLPEAFITVTDLSTNSKRVTMTSSMGQYALVNLSPGIYRITSSKSGFSSTDISGQRVSASTQTTVNFELAIGTSQTTIDIRSDIGTDLQTRNSTIGASVSPLAISSLPTIQRDVSTFIALQPGVSPDGSVGGTAVDQVTIQLDGGNNSSDMDGSTTQYTGSFGGDPTGIVAGQINGPPGGVMPMPVDSVEEVKVNTANQTADFNNSSGGQVEVVTKRGTNRWKGTVYEYYLDNNFGANTWDNNFQGTSKPIYHYNRFGAAAGGPILPNFLGGKTYLFAMFEEYRFPNNTTYERVVPSAAMRRGIVTLKNPQGTPISYDLNTLDPRGIGINPTVASLWNNYLPRGNDPSCGGLAGSHCDGVNELGFKSNVSLPENSNFGVTRIDHDFGAKWHLMASYRYFHLSSTTDNQIDIGGLVKGDTIGKAVSLANRSQVPWYLVGQVTTNITSSTTNDFHYSYLRNLWSWNDAGDPSQAAGLGGALEPFGESGTLSLVPVNVDTQDIRTRFWDGKDNFFSDNVSLLKGNHLIQFGGQYQHNFDYHQRSDDGNGINYTTTYQLGDASGSGQVSLAGLHAAGYPTGSNPSRIASAVLGIVTDAQQAYIRSGNNLTLNAPLTPASDKVTIPFYNVYFSDTWRLKPTFTFNFGLGWTLEMPPTEASGKQVALVDSNDKLVETDDYLNQKKAAALQGQVYNPEIGFALIGNVAGKPKYPMDPFYKSFSPRIAAAWNPKFADDSFLGHVFGSNATVLRGGYGRVYGRLNGVGLVLIPLLGAGLIQPVQCRLALSTGACGPSAPTDFTAFRIGVDGSTAPLPAASATLPQPLYPGYNNISSATDSVLDPHFRPNDVDSFDLTIQRQVTRKTMVEVGYIGRLIHHEFQPININVVPYMMTLGGQSFASAYAALETSLGCVQSAARCGANGVPTVAAQPFFEAALKGTGYCTGFSNCTTAVVNNEFSNLTTQAVWSMWSDLDNGGFNFPRSMMNTPIRGQVNGANGQVSSGVGLSTATGYGNYNGGFVSFNVTSWHGITLQENFTYSKALGTGTQLQATSGYTTNDAFDLNANYSVQPFNRKYVFNTFLIWEAPWYHNQEGLIGRMAGGWNIAPIFSAGSGGPLYCSTQTDGQSFGGADASGFTDGEQCVFTSKYRGGSAPHYGVTGTNGVGASYATNSAGQSRPVNMFANPEAVYNQTRAPILGIDTKNPGAGPITGLPYWNMDFSARKSLRVTETINMEFSAIFTNVFNHNIFNNPYLQVGDPGHWGVLTSQGNTPRKIQLGLRTSF